MTPELTTLAQFIFTGLAAAAMYWATQRKAKTVTQEIKNDSRNYADNLINVQSARVTDLESQITALQREVDQLRLQLANKQTEVANISRERDLALENQRLLQQELKDAQAALTSTLQRADEMEKRMETLERQQIGSEAVHQFVEQVTALIAKSLSAAKLETGEMKPVIVSGEGETK